MKKLFVMMMVLALAAMMALPAGVATASSPQFEVSGDLVLGIADLGIDPVGSVYKGWEYQVIDYAGDIDGAQIGTCYFTYNTKSLALASVGVQTFEGSVLGKTGTLTFRVLHQGFAQIGVLGETIKVEHTIVSGTGDLANLRGTMHFTVSNHGPTSEHPLGTYEGSYSGQLHFEP